MKKALVILLALTIVLGMSSFVFAQDQENNDNNNGTITHIHIHHFKIGVNISPIQQDAQITNTAAAQSGDATAIGNISDTQILSVPIAANVVLGSGSITGNAESKSKIKVINKGEAWATSGNATATNSGDNKIIQKAHVEFQQ